jgi:calcineurin-like phosphoesterase family protein
VISEQEAVRIIEKTDIKISSDYHLLRCINKRHNAGMYGEETKNTEDRVAMHNRDVKKDEPFLFLGDISEEEIHKPEGIAELYGIIRSLNGNPKILVMGNNDNFDMDFYHKCGFQYVSDKPLVCETIKVIFSHEPIDMTQKGLHKNGWINVHGHIHEHRTYFNIPQEGHINVYFGIHDDKVLKLSQYRTLYEKGHYNGETEYKNFWT